MLYILVRYSYISIRRMRRGSFALILPWNRQVEELGTRNFREMHGSCSKHAANSTEDIFQI